MTSKRAGYKELLRALLTRDSARAHGLAEELGDVPWVDSGLLVAAVFGLAAERRFRDDESHAAIKAFVAEAQQNYEDVSGAIKPLTAEAVVRAALGEPELIAEISRDEAFQTQLALTYKILDEEQATQADVDRLLDEAEELAEKWAPTR